MTTTYRQQPAQQLTVPAQQPTMSSMNTQPRTVHAQYAPTSNPLSAASPLPLGWEERPHASGQSQYYNIRTKELTWVRPTTTAAAPQSQPTTTASKNTDSLKAALETAHLSQYEDALRQLGVGTAADLVDLEEQDLIEIGMKKIEAKRLMRLAK